LDRVLSFPPHHSAVACDAGHIIRNWKNRFFVLQMANEGSRKCFRLLYYKEQANYEVMGGPACARRMSVRR